MKLSNGKKWFSIVMLIIVGALELFIIRAEYGFLNMTTNPTVAVIFGLSLIAATLLFLEVLKFPLAWFMHIVRPMWQKGVILLLIGVLGLATVETIVTGTSKTYELSIQPAIEANTRIRELEEGIAQRSEQNANLERWNGDLEAAVATIDTSVDARIRRLEEDRSAQLEQVDHELALLRGVGQSSVDVDDRVAELRRQITHIESSFASTDSTASGLVASLANDERAINQRLTEELQSYKLTIANEQSRIDEQIIAAQDKFDDSLVSARDQNRERVETVDSRLAKLGKQRAELDEQRKNEIDEHYANDRPFYNLADKLEKTNRRFDARIAAVDQESDQLRSERKDLLNTAALDEIREEGQSRIDKIRAEGTRRIESIQSQYDELRGNITTELSAIRERRQAIERDQLTAAMSARSDSTGEINRLNEEIKLILSDAEQKQQTAEANNAPAIQEKLGERERIRGRFAGLISTERQQRDASIESRRQSALTPVESQRLQMENEEKSLAARAEISQLHSTASESKRQSIVYQLSRLFAKTDTPTDEEVQFTLKTVLPIVAFVVAYVPVFGFKMGLCALYGTGRRRSISEIKHKLAAREERLAAEAIRERDEVSSELESAKKGAERRIAETEQRANREMAAVERRARKEIDAATARETQTKKDALTTAHKEVASEIDSLNKENESLSKSTEHYALRINDQEQLIDRKDQQLAKLQSLLAEKDREIRESRQEFQAWVIGNPTLTILEEHREKTPNNPVNVNGRTYKIDQNGLTAS